MAAGNNSFSFLALVGLCIVLILTISALPASGTTTSAVITSDIASLSPDDTTITYTTPDATSESTTSTPPDATSESTTSTLPDATSEPTTSTSPDATSEPTTSTSPDATSESTTSTSPDATSESTTSTSSDATSESTTSTSSDATSESTTSTSPDATSESTTSTSSDSTSESTTSTSPDATSESTTSTSPDATSESTTSTSSDATSESTTSTSPDATSESTTSTSSDATSEPTTFSSSDATSEPTTFTSPDATSEPTTSTSPDATSEPTTSSSSDATSEPTTSSSSDATSEPTTSSSSDATSEPTTSTSSDATSEPTTSSSSDATSEPTTSSSSDATSELTTTSATVDTTSELTTTSATVYTTSELTTTSTTTVATTKAPPPIKFQNISMVVTLNVRETQNKVLDTIVCVNYTGAHSDVKVNLASVQPRAGTCAQCFQILPCLTDWCLKYIPNIGTLNIGRDPVYSLTITCENADGYRITRLLEVRLTTNSPPVFNYTGLLASYTVQNTRNLKNGATIYPVNASDSDGDPLHYTMTVSPDNGNFQIGESDGVIRATNDLSGECSQLVTFYVYVTDNINSPVGPFVISTTLKDSNVAPSIINMGELIQVPEDTPAGRSIYKIDTRDDSININTIRYTLTVVPSQARSFFTISGDDIQLTSQLDYENPPGGYIRMTLTARAFDAEGCSSGIRTLYVEVTDRNEPPVIVPNSWTTTVYEGLIDFTPMWRIQDPDANDVAYFNFTTASSAFYIDSVTGAISSIGEYDLDSRKRTNETVRLPVTVTDRGGKTGTATVTVNILDANDNAPVISPASTSCRVEECKPVGTIVCSLKASDADSDFQQNNVIYFGRQSSTFFEVLYNGDVLLTSPIRNGDYSSATVVAYDQPCTTTTTTKATSTTTTSTSTTTDTSTTVSTTTGNRVEYNFMAENLPWLMVSALLGTCFVGLLGFMACRYARPGCRNKSPERLSLTKSEPPTTTHVEPKPHSNNFGPIKQDSTHVGRVGLDHPQPSFNFWSTMTKVD